IGPTLQQADTLLKNLNSLVSGEQSNLHTILATLPGAAGTTNAFLDQSNTISADIAPYRQYIDDIFPGLQTSFQDTDPNGNHFWSVYSVQCSLPPPTLPDGVTPTYGCKGDIPSSTQVPTGSAGGVSAA